MPDWLEPTADELWLLLVITGGTLAFYALLFGTVVVLG